MAETAETAETSGSWRRPMKHLCWALETIPSAEGKTGLMEKVRSGTVVGVVTWCPRYRSVPKCLPSRETYSVISLEKVTDG